jgi:hypothetical protein
LEILISEEDVDYYWKVQLIIAGSPGPMSETWNFQASHAVPNFGMELASNMTTIFIEQGESKSIQLTVQNTQDRYSDEIVLEFDKGDFPGEVELSNDTLMIGAGESQNIILNFITTSTTDVGNYQLQIIARSMGAFEFDLDINQSIIILVIVQNRTHQELDSDNDNLLDSWEEQWFGDIESYDGDDDPDLDGKTNYQEFQNNTDPTLPDIGPDPKTPKKPVKEKSNFIIILVFIPIIFSILLLFLLIRYLLKRKKGGGQQPEIPSEEPKSIASSTITPTQQPPQQPQNRFLDYNTQDQDRFRKY